MTKLLVSVRNSAEALSALNGGADIIDIKEPHLGSLGQVNHTTVVTIHNTVDKRVPVSMACGELRDWIRDHRIHESMSCADRPSLDDARTLGYPRLDFAKIGLSECGTDENSSAHVVVDWHQVWQKWSETLPAGMQPIAVIYADTLQARSPNPLEVIRRSQQLGCRGILIDTFDKRCSQSLLDIRSAAELARWITVAQSGDQFVALAGSLTIDRIPEVLRLGADIIAVRGAACNGRRTAEICEQKVLALSNALSAKITQATVQ